MLKTLLTTVFGSPHARYVKRLRPVLAAIHAHEERLKALSDAEIQAQTARFRATIAEKTSALRGELDQLKAEKHAQKDPQERLTLDDRIAKVEEAWKQAIAAVLREILPEAFATVREACRRLIGSTVTVTGHEMTWEMVPYDVQLIGGVVLHEGRIAEMATG